MIVLGPCNTFPAEKGTLQCFDGPTLNQHQPSWVVTEQVAELPRRNVAAQECCDVTAIHWVIKGENHLPRIWLGAHLLHLSVLTLYYFFFSPHPPSTRQDVGPPITLRCICGIAILSNNFKSETHAYTFEKQRVLSSVTVRPTQYTTYFFKRFCLYITVALI